MLRIAGILLVLLAGIAHAGIKDTKHNLSVTGSGTYVSGTEERVCIFCHTPHNAMAEAPLWNRELSTATYTPYDSNTLIATPGQPTGYSRMCLTCHDGTIALNTVRSTYSPITDLGVTITGGSNIGTDLADDHPVSFAYDSMLASLDGQVKDPSALPPYITLQDGRLECTSCHDAHTSEQPMFLVTDKPNLCISCHEKTGFADSQHNYIETRAPVSSEFACGNCHRPHHASETTKMRLLRGYSEELCFQCHGNGTVGVDVVVDGGVTADDPATWWTDGDIEWLMTHYSFQTLIQKGQINRMANDAHDVTDEHQALSGAKLECENCHGTHNLRPDDPSTLYTIESLSDPDDPSQRFTFSSPSHYAGADPVYLKMYGMDEFCLKCHDGTFPTFVDRPDLDVLGPTIPTGSNIINIAGQYETSIHSAAQTTAIKTDDDGSTMYGAAVPCIVCHDPHGANAFLITLHAKWDNPPWRTLGNSVIDADIDVIESPFRYQLCVESCHKGVLADKRPTHPTDGHPNGECYECHGHNNPSKF